MKGFITCLPACLIVSLYTPALSAAPIAWEIPSSGTFVTDVPPVRRASALPGLAHLTANRDGANRTAPLLDQLFASEEARAHSVHQRSYQWGLGITTIGIEGLRLQTIPTDRSTDRLIGTTRSKSWSIGARSDWAIGSSDRLSFGLATTTEHDLRPWMLTADPRVVTSVKTIGLTWSHGTHWRMSMGWQKTGGVSRGGADRMVELASGAALHESGMRMSLSFLPGGATDIHRTSLGFEARRQSVAANDLALIGASRRQDMRAGLFLRTHF